MMTKLPQCHRNIINYCPTMNKVIFMFKVPTFFSQLWALKCLLRNLWLKTACSYFSLLWFLHQQFCVSAILCHIQVICMIFFFFLIFFVCSSSEDLGAENSEQLYTSPPEIKAWAESSAVWKQDQKRRGDEWRGAPAFCQAPARSRVQNILIHQSLMWILWLPCLS